MARKPVLFSSLVKPIRSRWQRIVLFFGITACTLFMMTDHGEIDYAKEMRTGLTEVVLPVSTVITQPIKSISNLVNDVRNLSQAREEAKRLEIEVRKLRQALIMNQALILQNQKLKEQNNFVDFPDTKIISGRVVTHSGGPFVKSMLTNVGRENGARIGQAVVSEFGLVGIIVEVGRRFSRVLQITDINSQIPVVTEHTRDPAIMIGENTKLLKLKFIPNDSLLAVGDRIVTSGHGGLLPPDLPIGNVTKIDGANVFVSSLVDWDRLDYIRILDYRFADDLSPYLNKSLN